jgi:hypothetical protein
VDGAKRRAVLVGLDCFASLAMTSRGSPAAHGQGWGHVIVHEGLWEQLVGPEREEIARRAKCEYVRDEGRFLVRFLNAEYIVDLGSKEIVRKEASEGKVVAGYLEQLCVLAYLINAKDVAAANKLVKAETFPGGQFFFRGLHKLPTEKLAEVFGEQPERLYEAGEQFRARKREFGDASIEFEILPRVPVTIVVWVRDEEFGARASILFDQTAAEQMPLDALGVAADLAVKGLIKADSKDS